MTMEGRKGHYEYHGDVEEWVWDEPETGDKAAGGYSLPEPEFQPVGAETSEPEPEEEPKPKRSRKKAE